MRDEELSRRGLFKGFMAQIGETVNFVLKHEPGPGEENGQGVEMREYYIYLFFLVNLNWGRLQRK